VGLDPGTPGLNLLQRKKFIAAFHGVWRKFIETEKMLRNIVTIIYQEVDEF